MLLECHNCGAPLDVAEGARTVKCNYCGQSSKAKSHKTMAFETPKDWKPPTEWKPPAESPVGDAVLVYKPAAKAARAVLRALLFSGVMTVAIGGFIAYQVTSAVSQATNQSLSGLSGPDIAGVANTLAAAGKAALTASLAARKARLAAGESAVLCKGNDDVTLTDETLSLPSGIPIVASGNCTLHLVRCTVSGTTALALKNNASATVVGGSLTSERGPAITLSDNAMLDVSGGALVSGQTGLVATNNAKATLNGASVSGNPVAISTANAATVDATGATVSGSVVGKHPKRK